MALIEAAAAGRVDEVARLVRSGAPLEIQDAQGRSALLLAVAGNHVAVAKALIEAGASPNTQAANRDTPWLLAGALGRTEIIAAMLPRQPDLSIRNRYGGNALIPACERAHVEAVKLLLTSGIDLDHVNDLGWTCLLEIVILGDGGPRHQQVARLVLDAGADPNLADRDGVTPVGSCPPARPAGHRPADRTGRRPLSPNDLAWTADRATCAANAARPPPTSANRRGPPHDRHPARPPLLQSQQPLSTTRNCWRGISASASRASRRPMSRNIASARAGSA